MIRHFTASAIVFGPRGDVLMVHHRRSGFWLYPGGHVEPDEAPDEAAIRETREETGVDVAVVEAPGYRHPAVDWRPVPFAVLEGDVRDSTVGEHRHIDMVYVARAASTRLTTLDVELHDCRWVPIEAVSGLHTPAELPGLITAAADWVRSLAAPDIPDASAKARRRSQ